MCCMYATYEVIQSNGDEATEQTRAKFERISVIFTFDFSSGKWCALYCLLMCLMYATYEEIWSNKEEAMEQTLKNLE